MAHGKGRGAVELRYGRRGGGWLPSGHDPMAAQAEAIWAADAEAAKAAAKRVQDEARKADQRAAIATWEQRNDVVPGTASWHGDNLHGGPTGGTTWDGMARMADARRHAGQPLTAVDHDALRRAGLTDEVA